MNPSQPIIVQAAHRNNTLASSVDKEEVNKKVIILRTLGRGSFGKVKEALHSLTGEKIAIKILEKQKIEECGDQVRVVREMTILSKVSHPHIIQLYEIVETNKYYFFMMELAGKGELSSLIDNRGKLSETEARRMFVQLASAVFYLHSKGVSHRDLKPANVLLDDNYNVKLSDFGLGSFFRAGEKLKTPCGSPCFAAPEVILAEDYRPESSDVWGLGVTLYQLLTGKLPFDEPTKDRLYEKILNIKYDIPAHVSPPAVKLVRSLLQRDPKKRPSIAEIFGSQFLQVKPIPSIPLAIDPGIVYLACHSQANLDTKILINHLISHSMNKHTMAYWLFKLKSDSHRLTDAEKRIAIEGEKNGVETMTSTQADVRDMKTARSKDKQTKGKSVYCIKPKANSVEKIEVLMTEHKPHHHINIFERPKTRSRERIAADHKKGFAISKLMNMVSSRERATHVIPSSALRKMLDPTENHRGSIQDSLNDSQGQQRKFNTV